MSVLHFGVEYDTEMGIFVLCDLVAMPVDSGRSVWDDDAWRAPTGAELDAYTVADAALGAALAVIPFGVATSGAVVTFDRTGHVVGWLEPPALCGDHGADEPTCDHCGRGECSTPGMVWNGETGCHVECES